MSLGGQNKPRIVVTDDSAFMRKVISTALTRSGFEVVASGRDGDEALELCRLHKPDAMTLDLAMPGKDGSAVRLPCVSILRPDGDKVGELRVFIDVAPLYATG